MAKGNEVSRYMDMRDKIVRQQASITRLVGAMHETTAALFVIADGSMSKEDQSQRAQEALETISAQVSNGKG